MKSIGGIKLWKQGIMRNPEILPALRFESGISAIVAHALANCAFTKVMMLLSKLGVYFKSFAFNVTTRADICALIPNNSEMSSKKLRTTQLAAGFIISDN